jgi:hypothetical protein
MNGKPATSLPPRADSKKGSKMADGVLPAGHKMRFGLLTVTARSYANQGDLMTAAMYQQQAINEAEKNPDFAADDLAGIKRGLAQIHQAMGEK